jgi:hypothetical protein
VKLGLYANKMKAEVKFMRTAGYTHLDYKMNLNIMKKLNTPVTTEFPENCITNWKNHDLQMPHSRNPFQILHYQPNGQRSSERSDKHWHETITGYQS